MDPWTKNTYRVFRWNEEANNWVEWFTSAKTQKLLEFIRVMKLTEYPDVPDYPPTE